MPDAGRTREPCVQKSVHFCARKKPQGSRDNPAFPAQWCYGLLRALPGVPGLIASVAWGSSPQT